MEQPETADFFNGQLAQTFLNWTHHFRTSNLQKNSPTVLDTRILTNVERHDKRHFPLFWEARFSRAKGS